MSMSNERRQQILARLGIERLPPLTMMGNYDDQLLELQRPMNNLEIRGADQILGEEQVDRTPFRNMTVPARKCPKCEEDGQTVWVIPGKCCPRCGEYMDT